MSLAPVEQIVAYHEKELNRLDAVMVSTVDQGDSVSQMKYRTAKTDALVHQRALDFIMGVHFQ